MQTNEEKYFSIDILEEENNNIFIKRMSLSRYIKSTFPLLHAFREERSNECDFEKRKDLSRITAVILNKLNLPRYIIVKEINDLVYEPITKNIVFSNCVLNRKVIEEDLGYYFDHNYEDKVKNFFNPSMETRKVAQLTKEEFIEDRMSLKQERRKFGRKIKIKLKGMIKND